MDAKSSQLLVIVVNGTPILEYDRSQQLSKLQNESLELIDEKLDRGITLSDKFIPQPNLEQRVEFVAANLISALLHEEEVLAAASCAYLARALPDLKQIKALEEEGTVSIELIFDREFQPEEKMNYIPLEKITPRQH